MKNSIITRVLTPIIIALSLASCKKESVEPGKNNTLSQQDSLINFHGLPVKHTYDNPEITLNYEEKDYKQLFVKNMNQSLSSGKRIMSAEQAEYPNLTEMANIEEQNLVNYPNFSRLDSIDLQKIKTNFPTLTDKQIADNIGIIEQYYTKNLQYDVLMDAIECSSKKITNGDKTVYNKTAFYYPYKLSSEEFWYLWYRPTAAWCINSAKNKAFNYTDAIYGVGKAFMNRGDAFRHALWNILIAKYYADNKGSVGQGLTLAEEFTNIHERSNVAQYGDPEREMDYHNNLQGRRIFERSSRIEVKRRWWWFDKRTLVCPSDDEYKNMVKSFADRAYQVPLAVQSVRAISIDELVYFW